MEILRGRPTDVRFVVPTDLASATFDTYRDGVAVGTTGTATVAGGYAYATPSWSAVAQEGTLKVSLKFFYENAEHVEDRYVSVVSPYVEIDEVKELLESNDEDALEAERAARFIINAHCGQSFGKYREKRVVSGSGTDTLQLPNRILEFKSFNDLTDLSNFVVSADGFFLRFEPWGVPPVKADYYGLHQHVGGVIHNPNNVKLGIFKAGGRFEIDAVWGYYEVPNEVKEAAKILVGLYGDPDSEYRDRYLTSMTAADWRIQFNERAFAETGHARADQLLAPFVLRRGWAVI